MPTYSNSRLSTYENCPFQFKLTYIDRIKRETEGVEAFLGNRVHETLRKCYDDIRRTKLNTLDELLACYESLWQKNWHDDIVINRKELTAEHYRNLGRKMLETYYQRYAPFGADITIGTELMLNFALDEAKKYRLTGLVDRLARAPDGVFWIHDYKTSAHLPSQEEADRDRQLALYQIGVRKRWPDVQNIRLVWHYLAFDYELISRRTDESLAELVNNTTQLIDRIQADIEFAPKESVLCDWCEYPDLCPQRKHLFVVENLPPNQYLTEPGVVLVNKYAELKQKASEIDQDMEQVREALIEYARRENVSVITGSGQKARIRSDMKLKFPSKNDPERDALDNAIIQAGKWADVSQLDTNALTRIIEHESWDKTLIDRVMQYGKLEQTTTISLSKLKEREE
ncbi:MAG TPA: PD-(D/E)XK nuclease family protein [Dehalococcoidales bacterium]